MGALLGLTGLGSSGDPAQATATALGSSFDVGFGIQTDEPAEGLGRATYLLPHDASLLEIADVSATPPGNVTGLPARIGFLKVTADLTDLTLGTTGPGPAAVLNRVGLGPTDPLLISDLLTGDGALDPDQLELDSARQGVHRLHRP